jgi:hypothetical protein
MAIFMRASVGLQWFFLPAIPSRPAEGHSDIVSVMLFFQPFGRI